MALNLKHNHFELFGLPQRFSVDIAQLDTRYRELQREVHPDRFAAASPAEQRVSMQLATRVNEACQTLKSPLARARYLLQLHGVDPQFETNTAMPPGFLDEQLELREALDETAQAGDAARLDALSTRLQRDRDALLSKLEAQLDVQGAWAAAATTLRQLMFLEKFRDEIDAAEERLEG
ncbi:MAG: Fe-S protein assembly co-chaperone HscB [Burkholderiales bacterium]